MPKPPLQRLTGWITKSIAATSRVTAGSSLSKQRPLCGWSEALDHAEFTASALIIVYAPRIKKSILIPQDPVVMQFISRNPQIVYPQ